ncbi:MAG TPA: hypothetical protein VES73_18065 [Lamprocystis sp. (in: g-proteobacteria)]|nr:hypothetical protein [Lamprocystis sp. (in: g-proteobacteria)]
MGRFTEDMGRLRDEITADRLARHTLIDDTRQEVTDAAHAFMRDLKDSVETLQVNFREAHADMAETTRADRNAFLARLGGAVADIRVNAANRQAAVREEFVQTVAASRAQREQATAAIRDDVSQLMDGFQNARGVMSMEVRAAGQSFVSGIVDTVAGLQRQTQQLVGEFAGERSAARQAWRGQASAPAAPAPAVSHKVQAKPAAKAQHKAVAHKERVEKPEEKPMMKEVPAVRASVEDVLSD